MTPLLDVLWRVGRAVLIALGLAFLFLPLLAVFTAVAPVQALRDLGSPVAIAALLLSLRTTAWSLTGIVAFGTPLALWLSRGGFPGKRIVETAIGLPIVVPPAVAGVGLLLVLGRRGLLGPLLASAHVSIVFTATAVALAQAFVAGPLYVIAARQAFDAVDPDLIAAARTLGASPMRAFWRIELPLASSGIAAGAALAAARALGEFGATMLFAGNLPGITQTLPLAIYTALDSGLDTAVAMSELLLFAAFLLLLLITIAGRRRFAAADRAGARDSARLPVSQTAR